MIYINCLILDRIQHVVGFSESKGILNSLMVYSCIPNTLNKFDKLLNELSILGYDVRITDNITDIASKLRIDNITFTDSERKYINFYLKAKEIVKIAKSIDST